MRSVLMILRLCAILWLQCLGAADGLDTWTLRSSPLPSTNWLYSIAYGSGQFVAAAGNPRQFYQGPGVIVTSQDGTNWVQETVPSGTGTFLSVTGGKGIYVAAGRSTLISVDGRRWTTPLSASFSSSAVAYGNNIFVAGSYPNVYVSTNSANTWMSHPLNLFESSLLSIAYGQGQFLAATTHGGMLASTNGIEWIGRSIQGFSTGSVSYGNGAFIVVGSGGAIATSTDDGITWTQRNSGISSDLLGITCGGGIFATVGRGGTILTSTDTATWTPRASGVTNDLTAVACGKGHFLAVGANGTILESGAVLHLGQSKALLNGAFQLTLTGASGQRCEVQSSADLTNWTVLTEFVLAEPSITLVITSPTNFSQRFYRAVVP